MHRGGCPPHAATVPLLDTIDAYAVERPIKRRETIAR